MDRLPLGPDAPYLRPGFALPHDMGANRLVLRPQQDHFSGADLGRLTAAVFEVTAQRDRMAMVLGGMTRGHGMVSVGAVPGSLQVPGSRWLCWRKARPRGYPRMQAIASVDVEITRDAGLDAAAFAAA